MERDEILGRLQAAAARLESLGISHPELDSRRSQLLMRVYSTIQSIAEAGERDLGWSEEILREAEFFSGDPTTDA